MLTKILILCLMIVVFGGTIFLIYTIKFSHIPSNLLQDFEQEKGFQRRIEKCQNGSETIYVLGSNGGFSGFSRYYTAEGKVIGVDKWDDIITADDLSKRPVVDTSKYFCVQIQS